MPDLRSLVLLAQQAAEQAAQQAPPAEPPDLGSLFTSISFPILLTVLIILMFNPFGRRDEKKRTEFLNSLKKNDRVLLTNGIYGRIVTVREGADEVLVRVDEDRDVKILVTTASILKRIEKPEEAAKPPVA